MQFYTNKMEDGDFDQRLRDLQREYLEFLDDEVCIPNLFIYSLFEGLISHFCYVMVIVGGSRDLYGEG